MPRIDLFLSTSCAALCLALPAVRGTAADARSARLPRAAGAIAQEAYLKASNSAPGDQFGVATAVSGDIVVVGASFEDSSATGVNGDQEDDAAPDAGAAYVLVRMDGKDPLVKTHLINVLARFDRPDVNKALREALRDSNKLVRGAALQGIARSKTAVDVALISGLLLDPDLDVMNKAVDVIIQLNHPETAKYLIDALKAENEFSRRSAVEILNAIGTTHSIKYLLEAFSDEDWWVRSRASDALARIGGPLRCRATQCARTVSTGHVDCRRTCCVVEPRNIRSAAPCWR